MSPILSFKFRSQPSLPLKPKTRTPASQPQLRQVVKLSAILLSHLSSPPRKFSMPLRPQKRTHFLSLPVFNPRTSSTPLLLISLRLGTNLLLGNGLHFGDIIKLLPMCIFVAGGLLSDGPPLSSTSFFSLPGIFGSIGTITTYRSWPS